MGVSHFVQRRWTKIFRGGSLLKIGWTWKNTVLSVLAHTTQSQKIYTPEWGWGCPYGHTPQFFYAAGFRYFSRADLFTRIFPRLPWPVLIYGILSWAISWRTVCSESPLTALTHSFMVSISIGAGVSGVGTTSRSSASITSLSNAMIWAISSFLLFYLFENALARGYQARRRTLPDIPVSIIKGLLICGFQTTLYHKKKFWLFIRVLAYPFPKVRRAA